MILNRILGIEGTTNSLENEKKHSCASINDTFQAKTYETITNVPRSTKHYILYINILYILYVSFEK